MFSALAYIQIQNFAIFILNQANLMKLKVVAFYIPQIESETESVCLGKAIRCLHVVAVNIIRKYVFNLQGFLVC